MKEPKLIIEIARYTNSAIADALSLLSINGATV
jgi:hypothetical protein